jgi:hypothetical protein
MDLAAELGTNGGISVQCLTVYIPDRDREGNEVPNQRTWVLRAANVLARIGGGATIMPVTEGLWLDDNGQVIQERTVLVYTFIRPDLFREMLPKLRTFLHSFGRETGQAEVAFDFDGRFYRIRKFDAAGE